MTPTWVVTGTDTDVGKSVVTAALAAGWVSQGQRVAALKPIASGVPAGEMSEDARTVAAHAGHEPRVWQSFSAPVSPHRAQALDRRLDLDEDALFSWIAGYSQDADSVLVEAAGGWRVPLMLGRKRGYIEAKDLATRLKAPVIIVAADKLGVLNHTLLTVNAVRADGCEVQGVILNRKPLGQDDQSRAYNLEDLQTMLNCPVHPFPPVDPADREAMATAGEIALSALRMRILAG